MERGVLIDGDGFVLAMLEWEEGTPAPKFNQKITKGARVRRTLLRDEYAIANARMDARWDATPVIENGVQVRSGTWQFPTEQRWLVRQRPDIPHVWALVGPRLVWPTRLPRVPRGQMFVDVAPTEFRRGERLLWDSIKGEWFYPMRRAVVAPDGTCKRISLAVSEEHIAKEAEDRVVDPAVIEVADELGEVRSLQPGDKLDQSDVVVEAARPRYPRIPIDVLEDVLAENNLGAAFVTFIEGKGYTLSQVRSVGKIGLGNQLLREFVEGQGFTMLQARNALQRRAQELLRQRKQVKEQILGEDR